MAIVSAPSLVSVCIITYNSGRTIVDTLDSVCNQTYPRIEIVISDDCSKDNTVALCRNWLEEHKHRFETSRLIEREKNGGVAENLNTAIMASTGDWLKPLSGDDLLLPECIQDNMDQVTPSNGPDIVFSKMHYFVDEGNGMVLTDYCKPEKELLSFFTLPSAEQYRLLLSSCIYVPGPTVFQKRSFAIKHLFPAEYPFCEDWPHWTHLTRQGVQLSYFDKETVLYRNGGSLSHAQNDTFINEKFHHSMMAFFYAERYQSLLDVDINSAREQKREFFLGEVALTLLGNRRNLFTRAILFVFKLLVGTRKVQ